MRVRVPPFPGSPAPQTEKTMANKSGSSYIVIGSKATNFTVSPSQQSAPRQVVATVLLPSRPQLAEKQAMRPAIKKVLLKAVSRHSKGKDPKMFALRNIVPDRISCCNDIKSLIKEQLSDDIVEDDFDLGHVQGNTVVSLRSKADLDEMWEGLTKGLNITLWCDGLPVEQTSSRKRPVSAVENDDEVESSKEKKRKKKKDDTSKE